MRNLLLPVFTVIMMSLTVTFSAFAQDTSKQAAEDKVEAKMPSLTFYYIDQ